jgi:two-component system, LuxR family, response regulator FixJ
MSTKATVFIVDDEPEVRKSLATIVKLMGLEAQCFDSASAFLAAYDPARAGCLLVDLKMPEVSGIELLERLAQRRWRVPAVMLSGYGDVPAAVRAMQCGALDFLEKPSSLDSLRQSIVRAVDLDARLRDDNTNRDKVSRAMETLTAEERRVLELTADGKPDKAIAARLNLSTRTIQLRRASVMRKLGASSRTELVRRLSPWLERDATTGRLSAIDSASWGALASSG